MLGQVYLVWVCISHFPFSQQYTLVLNECVSSSHMAESTAPFF